MLKKFVFVLDLTCLAAIFQDKYKTEIFCYLPFAEWAVPVFASLCLSVLGCACLCYPVLVFVTLCFSLLRCACLCYDANRVPLCWPLCVPLLFRNRILTLSPLCRCFLYFSIWVLCSTGRPFRPFAAGALPQPSINSCVRVFLRLL